MQYPAKTPAQLGDILRGYRRSKKLNQRTVGQFVGLPQNSVSVIETHTDTVSVERLFKLLSALGLEMLIAEKSSGPPSAQEW
jgi:HTH-type transcriptional regulator / antitoxin HipB